MILKPASRYPADPRAVFILAFSILTGITAIITDAKPGTLQDALPDWGVLIWGAMLIGGSATALVGTFFQGIGGIVTEQIGSMTVSMATAFYSIVLLWVAGEEAIFSSGIILGWGLACLLRWLQLQILIETAYHEKLHRKAEQAVCDEIDRRRSQ